LRTKIKTVLERNPIKLRFAECKNRLKFKPKKSIKMKIFFAINLPGERRTQGQRGKNRKIDRTMLRYGLK